MKPTLTLLTALLLAPLAALQPVAYGYGESLGATSTLDALQAGWERPGRSYKPHTRWWWPGNVLTKTEITWQLEQMARQGIGGVEIMSAWRMYEKGHVDFLSPAFLELVQHAVAEGKRLDLDVAITFSPGWSFGGPWVAKEDQSKVLCCGSVEVEGGGAFAGALPKPSFKARGKQKQKHADLPPETGTEQLVAVVAAKSTGAETLDGHSLVVLTPQARDGKLQWDAPPGKWRVMAFWLKYTGQICQAQSFDPPAVVIDHLNKGAVQRYCDHLGGAFFQAVGQDFGTTMDSFFCDSFEIHPLPESLLWSGDTLAGFHQDQGYDLTPYLPALWFDIGPKTPRVRYDLGHYLHRLGLETIFKTFNDWCDAHHTQARIQPHYRFTVELVQGAGTTARPETEVTTARFEPVADPRKATASGARFYGRDIVSAESYTFIHPARYRTDLQDLKIATDAFLRDGITQFYNHGYFASPEMHVAPSRDMPWANRISHWNTWWPYYHHVANYVARSCFMLRQGRLVADVLIYSPQATAWSERALWGTERRVMPYGDLAKTLVANGYDFDIANDDLLQHRAQFADGGVTINGYAYRILLLPRATVVPLETMRAMEQFAAAGGRIIALDELPAAAAGLKQSAENDRELKAIVQRLFHPSGTAVFLADYKMAGKVFDPGRKPYSPTPPLTAPQRQLLAALAKVTPPDFALAGGVQSDGLTFIHKRVADLDVYFVCNLQPVKIATDVTFRTGGQAPQRWDAIRGTMTPLPSARVQANATTIPLDFEPWESAFFVFAPGTGPSVATPPEQNLPAPLAVEGTWHMKLEGHGFETYTADVTVLASWTHAARTKHFSGTGCYEIEFDLPAERITAGARMLLDLGRVGTIADVELNGKAVGVAWMTPYRLDITGAAQPGRNKLAVKVTNTLINYVSGLKEPPEVPVELQERLGKANPDIYPHSQTAKREMSETDLPPSGLIGPVQIRWQ